MHLRPYSADTVSAKPLVADLKEKTRMILLLSALSLPCLCFGLITPRIIEIQVMTSSKGITDRASAGLQIVVLMKGGVCQTNILDEDGESTDVIEITTAHLLTAVIRRSRVNKSALSWALCTVDQCIRLRRQTTFGRKDATNSVAQHLESLPHEMVPHHARLHATRGPPPVSAPQFNGAPVRDWPRLCASKMLCQFM